MALLIIKVNTFHLELLLRCVKECVVITKIACNRIYAHFVRCCLLAIGQFQQNIDQLKSCVFVQAVIKTQKILYALDEILIALSQLILSRELKANTSRTPN